MKLIHTISETREEVRRAKADGKRVGLVPTMGALHEGHITLVKRAREDCEFVAVSVFVNPTQFGPNEDFDKYPRTLEQDAAKCEAAGVDIIFAPSASEMYPQGFDSWVDVSGVTQVLEGEHRPTHFRGVTTVCTKLFNIVCPDRAYFGRKDYQQLKVIQKMVRDLNMPLEIMPVDIVRESDGLAMSSRNRYLSADERKAALVLSRSLATAQNMHASGERSADVIRTALEQIISAEPLAKIDYVAVVDAETLLPIETLDSPAAVLLAVKIGATRLIDNTVLE